MEIEARFGKVVRRRTPVQVPSPRANSFSVKMT
jgi:hypothetical protein